MKKQETRTIALKLVGRPEAFTSTMEAYISALNYISQHTHKKKRFDHFELQRALCKKVRAQFGLKSQMTVNSLRQVSSAYKSIKSNGRKKGKKQSKATSTPAVFNRTSILLNYPRDWKFKDAGTLSLNTLEGGKPVAFVCGKHQRAYLDEVHAGIEGGWKIRSGRLIRRKNGDWYFNIAMTKEFEVGGGLEDRTTVIGVDLGINNIAVAHTTDGSVRFFKGGETKNKKRRFESTRSHLQAKGTRSAKRTLMRLSGRERRFTADINHQVSKELVRFASGFPNPLIALEDLTGIKKRLGTKP